MNTKTTLSISEARKRIFEIAKKVQKPSTHYILTNKGKPRAVFMSAEEFESWQETLEAIHDFPNLEKDVKRAEKEYEQGNYETLQNVLAKEGFVLAKKSQE